MQNLAPPTTPQVYDLQMQPSEVTLWETARPLIIAGGVELAKERGCRLLRVLDPDGKLLYLEGW